MSKQDFPQLPQDQQWEYATLMMSRTAGFFGVVGAKQNVKWSSTLEGEGESNFEQSTPDLLYRVGRAGWELVSSPVETSMRGGTTHESTIVFVFKQRVATTEDYALAQLIDPVALLKRATKYMQQNPSLAIKALNRALSFDPQQRELYYLTRGRVYLSIGDEERALEDFGRAIQANEQCGEAYWERANIVFKRADYENTINDCTQVLRFVREAYDSPPSVKVVLAEARYNRGLAYRQVGKVKDAIKDFKEYLNRTQHDPDKLFDPNKRSEVEALVKELERRK